MEQSRVLRPELFVSSDTTTIHYRDALTYLLPWEYERLLGDFDSIDTSASNGELNIDIVRIVGKIGLAVEVLYFLRMMLARVARLHVSPCLPFRVAVLYFLGHHHHHHHHTITRTTTDQA